jgi:hypothetical protein
MAMPTGWMFYVLTDWLPEEETQSTLAGLKKRRILAGLALLR